MSWGQYLPPGFIVRQRDGAGKAPSLGADPQVHRVSSGLFLLLLSLSFLTREMEMKLQDTGYTLHWQDLPGAEAGIPCGELGHGVRTWDTFP